MEAWNGTIIKQNSAVVLIFVPGKLPLSLLFLEHGLKQENKNKLRHGNQRKEMENLCTMILVTCGRVFSNAPLA